MKRRISVQFCLMMTSSSVGHAAFIHGAPAAGIEHPNGREYRRRRLAKHEAFEQRVGRQAIGAMQPAFGAFTRGIEAGRSVRPARSITIPPQV
jgi:hypothetical protein